MTTYNTGNPIGSTDPRDLYDNAQNLDEAVNTRTAESWGDRFGVARKTWWGMEQDFQNFLINSGYQDIGDYAAGLEITARNQIFWRAGEQYRAGASLELPYTTTGEWPTEEGLFVAVGDAALRQELASHGGGEMVGVDTSTGQQTLNAALDDRASLDELAERVLYKNSIDDLEGQAPETLIEGQEASVLGSHFQFLNGTWEPTTVVNAASYGVSPNASAAYNAVALQRALNDCAGKAKVRLQAGTYYIDASLTIPSESVFFGDGPETIIKGAETMPRSLNLIQTGARGNPVRDVCMHDMTLDFNRARWTVDGAPGDEDANRTTLCIVNTKNSVFKRLRVLDGYKHSIDITAPSYQTGGGAVTYDDDPSEYIWLDNCYASGAGDDNITTHQSTYIWITHCVSENPSGVIFSGAANANCIEIDDGSRNVWVDQCLVRGGKRGIEIKGHSTTPAPYNVNISNCMCINNVESIRLIHPGFQQPPESFSLTARMVNLTNIICIAPALLDESLGDATKYCVHIRGYSYVNINNLFCTDGTEDLLNKEYEPTQVNSEGDDAIIAVVGNSKFVNMSNVTIRGFSPNRGVTVVEGARNVKISNFNSYDCLPADSVVRIADNVVDFKLDNWSIVNEAGAIGDPWDIRITGTSPSDTKSVGAGYSFGYGQSLYHHHWEMT